MADYIVDTAKRCWDCRETKPRSDFHRSRKAKDGLQGRCKPCSKKSQREYKSRSEVIKKHAHRASDPLVYEGPPKECRRCGEYKPRSDFRRHRLAADGLHTWCHTCQNQYSRDRNTRPEVKESVRQNDRTRRNEFRAYVEELKAKPCQRCGASYPPYVMDFHHRDPSTKKFSVGTMSHQHQSRVIAEIAKCVLLCANCHRIVEWEGKYGG